MYVPNGLDNTVSVIDPVTFKLIKTFKVANESQHVVPSHDLKTLWVASDQEQESADPIDPRTGRPGQPIPTVDAYNLYFTPGGQYGIVVAENKRALNFTDPQTVQMQFSVKVPCRGVNHMDFSADGRTLLAACEFSGDLQRVDLVARKVVGRLHVGGMPQDVKQVYYVADLMANGVRVISAGGAAPKKVGFVATGKGTQGLYPSQAATRLFISNRGEGTVSVLSFATRRVIARWIIPGGGSPDMGSVSPDGTQLWRSGRYTDVV